MKRPRKIGLSEFPDWYPADEGAVAPATEENFAALVEEHNALVDAFNLLAEHAGPGLMFDGES
ncbi:MAG: hypothetical protein ABUJ92_00230 [Desulfobacterales bacterium]